MLHLALTLLFQSFTYELMSFLVLLIGGCLSLFSVTTLDVFLKLNGTALVVIASYFRNSLSVFCTFMEFCGRLIVLVWFSWFFQSQFGKVEFVKTAEIIL